MALPRRTDPTLIAVLLMCFTHAPTVGADDDAKALSEARMKVMVERVSALQATDAKGQPIPLLPKPFFRYTDPIRATHDGIFAGWAKDGGRPAAIIGLFTEPSGDNVISWSYEFIALSDEKPKIVSTALYKAFRWTPVKSELVWHTIPVSKSIPRKGIRILNQLKALSSRFTVTEEMRGIHRLRRLPKPIHTYQDKTKGIEMGAIFLFAYGTNPEAILLVECRSAPNTPKLTWHYALARATAAEVWAEFDGAEVWRPEIAYRTGSLGDPKSSYFIEGMESGKISR